MKMMHQQRSLIGSLAMSVCALLAVTHHATASTQRKVVDGGIATESAEAAASPRTSGPRHAHPRKASRPATHLDPRVKNPSGGTGRVDADAPLTVVSRDSDGGVVRVTSGDTAGVSRGGEGDTSPATKRNYDSDSDSDWDSDWDSDSEWDSDSDFPDSEWDSDGDSDSEWDSESDYEYESDYDWLDYTGWWFEDSDEGSDSDYEYQWNYGYDYDYNFESDVTFDGCDEGAFEEDLQLLNSCNCMGVNGDQGFVRNIETAKDCAMLVGQIDHVDAQMFSYSISSKVCRAIKDDVRSKTRSNYVSGLACENASSPGSGMCDENTFDQDSQFFRGADNCNCMGDDGDDAFVRYIESAKDCATLVGTIDHEDAQLFTYQTSSKKCWAKKEGSSLKSKPGFVSGTACEPPDPDVDDGPRCDDDMFDESTQLFKGIDNCNCMGDTSDAAYVRDIESAIQCAKLVGRIDHHDAQMFSYQISTKKCWAKKNESATRSRAGYVSGSACLPPCPPWGCAPAGESPCGFDVDDPVWVDDGYRLEAAHISKTQGQFCYVTYEDGLTFDEKVNLNLVTLLPRDLVLNRDNYTCANSHRITVESNVGSVEECFHLCKGELSDPCKAACTHFFYQDKFDGVPFADRDKCHTYSGCGTTVEKPLTGQLFTMSADDAGPMTGGIDSDNEQYEILYSRSGSNPVTQSTCPPQFRISQTNHHGCVHSCYLQCKAQGRCTHFLYQDVNDGISQFQSSSCKTFSACDPIHISSKSGETYIMLRGSGSPPPTPNSQEICYNRKCGCPPFTDGAEWCHDESAGDWGPWCNLNPLHCTTCGGVVCLADTSPPTSLIISPTSTSPPPASDTLQCIMAVAQEIGGFVDCLLQDNFDQWSETSTGLLLCLTELLQGVPISELSCIGLVVQSPTLMQCVIASYQQFQSAIAASCSALGNTIPELADALDLVFAKNMKQQQHKFTPV